MVSYFIISGIILLILLGLGIFIAILSLKKFKEIKKSGEYPEGHFVALGMILGMPLGIPLGIAMGNIALGLPIGLPIGLAFGAALESKYQKQGKIRPLTKQEEKQRSIAIWIGVGFIGLAILAGLGILLFR